MFAPSIIFDCTLNYYSTTLSHAGLAPAEADVLNFPEFSLSPLPFRPLRLQLSAGIASSFVVPRYGSLLNL